MARLDSEVNPLHWGHTTSAFGKHYRGGMFIPHKPVDRFRCPKCSTLLEGGFFVEDRCPICGDEWTRQQQKVDMYVESLNAEVQGGWDKSRLDVMQDKTAFREKSVTMSQTTHNGGEVGARARNTSAWKIATQEHAHKEAMAYNLLIHQLRNQNEALAGLRDGW